MTSSFYSGRAVFQCECQIEVVYGGLFSATECEIVVNDDFKVVNSKTALNIYTRAEQTAARFYQTRGSFSASRLPTA